MAKDYADSDAFLVHREMTSFIDDSEWRFRMLVEAVQEYAIYMLDPDGIVTIWNAGAERNKG